MHVLAVVAATWVGLMGLLIARARQGSGRPPRGGTQVQREEAPTEG
jgi:hypothetical protein